jgi:hypothetical protein
VRDFFRQVRLQQLGRERGLGGRDRDDFHGTLLLGLKISPEPIDAGGRCVVA